MSIPIIIHSPKKKLPKLKLTPNIKLTIAIEKPRMGTQFSLAGLLLMAVAENISKNPTNMKSIIENTEWTVSLTPSGNKAVTKKENAKQMPEICATDRRIFIFLSPEFHL